MAYRSINPYTGAVLKTYPDDSDATLETAVARAEQVFQGAWRNEPMARRADVLRRAAKIMRSKSEELARYITLEMGKLINESVAEVALSADILEYYADNGPKMLAAQKLIVEEGEAFVESEPLGVLFCVEPWNFPYYQVARFAGPNHIIGNAVLLKHAPQCPESAEAIVQIFKDAGYPEGCYENIYATNEQIEWVIADPRVHGVSVTGSERAGAAVAEIAGRNLKKVVLELGGSDPFILLGTDDVGEAAQKASEARLDNAGQSCNAAKRFIVIDSLYDDFLEQLKQRLSAATPGDPAAPGAAMGPLSSKAAAERLEDQVKRAIDAGAQLVLGGGRQGNFYEPTILTGIKPGDAASQEEFFGPVAQVYKVSSEAEAVALANDTQYGLGSYLMTNAHAQAERVADQIEAGMVYVNLVGADSPELPFGGFKRSGFGRELGRYGADEFVNKKLIRSA